MATVYDHIVIGAGIVGSCTAWQLAAKGKNVLLLEQFHLPTTRGSSHGATRLIRTAYSQKYYASMMPEAFNLWRQIEKGTDTKLIENTKAFCVLKDKEEFDQMVANMKEFSPDNIQVMDPKSSPIAKTMNLSKDHYCVLDTTGGVIFAHKALTAVQSLFKKHGGEIRDNCTVTSLTNTADDDVLVATSNGTIRAHSVVVCAGCWASRLFNSEVNRQLSKCTQPVAIKVFYWKILKSPGKDFSSVLDSSEHDFETYTIATEEYPGLMKVCVHGRGIPCNPDEREKAKFDGTTEEKLKEYIKHRLPFLDSKEPAIVEKCMYTNSLDEDFIIDKVPTYKNVYIGSGFSGTGFKTSPAVGRLLCELALGVKPFQDLTPFLLSRFK